MPCQICQDSLSYYGVAPDPCPHAEIPPINEDEVDLVDLVVYASVAFGSLMQKNPLAVLRDWKRDAKDPLHMEWARKIFDEQSKLMEPENDRTTLPQIDIRK